MSGSSRWIARRGGARRNGAKSDELDAIRAAHEALGREHLAQPRRRGDREAIRVLIVTAREELRHQLRNIPTDELVNRCARLRTLPSHSHEHRAIVIALRHIARRVLMLQAEANDLETELERLVKRAVPMLLDEIASARSAPRSLLVVAPRAPAQRRRIRDARGLSADPGLLSPKAHATRLGARSDAFAAPRRGPPVLKRRAQAAENERTEGGHAVGRAPHDELFGCRCSREYHAARSSALSRSTSTWKGASDGGHCREGSVETEGENVALRFVVRSEGHSVAVELRGKQIHGVLDDGDEVRLQGGSLTYPERLWRPLMVENRTTGSTITAIRPSAAHRAARQAREATVPTIVTLILGGVVKPIVNGVRALFRGGRVTKVAAVIVVTGAAGFGALQFGKSVLDTQGVITVAVPPSNDAAGYSVCWTRGRPARPDARPELPATASSIQSQRLPEGRWYLNVRTIGGRHAGSIRHAGPFVIRG